MLGPDLVATSGSRKKAVVAVGRSILVIISPAHRPRHRYTDTDTDLGSDSYATRINPGRRKRGYIRQLEAPATR
jgi:hypothetical protein